MKTIFLNSRENMLFNVLRNEIHEMTLDYHGFLLEQPFPCLFRLA